MCIDRKWKSGADFAPLSPEERAALQREWAEAKAKRQAERERSETEAAAEAVDMWSRAAPASADHAYAAKKRLDPSPLRELDGKLLIPMVDAAGKLWNLQRIAGDGTKRFLRGGRTDGLFCLIGYDSKDARTFCLGEGYATMAAVHRASGHPCIVCFSAKNMAAVARLWNAARPDLGHPYTPENTLQRGGKHSGRMCRACHREKERARWRRAKTATAVAEEIGAKAALPVAPAREAAA
jgi:putative DNA primase/helicase